MGNDLLALSCEVQLVSLKARYYVAMGFIYNKDLGLECRMLAAQIQAVTSLMWPVKHERCYQPNRNGNCLTDLKANKGDVAITAICPHCNAKRRAS